MVNMVDLPEVFCFNCVQAGHLEVYPFSKIPFMNCRLCRWFVLGYRDGDDLVFPDPHVVPETGQSS